LFGLGPYVKDFLTSLGKDGVLVDYIIDESFLNWGKKIKGCEICSRSRLQKENPKEIVVLIGTHEIGRINEILEDWGMIHIFAYYLFFEKMYESETIEGYTVSL
jgi:hypothetical protein